MNQIYYTSKDKINWMEEKQELFWWNEINFIAAAVNKPIFLSILLFENEKNEERWLIAALLPKRMNEIKLI